ncbi:MULTISPECIES: Sec-independent protein translocase protein TatB [unclassified Nocardia]|uniref:Sec-independent protein translocase protein TatB n=1 Tax=unclassified Nocardia TaxID=2637762 RepID=UPI0035E0A3BE
MFGIGWGEMIILLAAALLILGPERLPGAVVWTLRSVRQVRDYAVGAAEQLKQELGPEVEELRKPLAELNRLRGSTPQTLITKHLLDGDESLLSAETTSTGSAPTTSLFHRPEPTTNFGIMNEPVVDSEAGTPVPKIDTDAT